MEIDHIFICVAHGAKEAEALKAFGLDEGAPNQHPGQGTANRRFFFRNAFIELLYLDNLTEINSKLTKPTGLFERLTANSREVSPFGIGFRSAASSGESLPFPSWGYRPMYLPKDFQINIGIAPLTEPMWFCLPSGLTHAKALRHGQQPLEHPAGLKEITSVGVVIPDLKAYSEPAARANQIKGLRISQGDNHLLVLGFDGELMNRSHDFRPLLPLLLRW